MSGDRRRQGGGSKVGIGGGLEPPLLSSADFFTGDGNFDLLGHPIGASRSAAKGRPIIHSDELGRNISHLVEVGLTRAEIAKVVGMSEASLYAEFFAEAGVRQGKPGRRRHEPSSAGRSLVSRRCAAGASRKQIASALGISLPTLRLHYREELKSGGDNGEQR